MKIGYARVSSKWYLSEVQLSELEAAGCSRVLKMTGSPGKNAELDKFLEVIKPGDTVMVNRLVCAARSPAELIVLMKSVSEKGASFRSLAEPWADTSKICPDKLLEVMRGMMDLIFEMNGNDLMSPQTVGVQLGRPKALTDKQKYEVLSLLKIGKSAAETGRMFGVSRSTISRLKRKSV